MVPILELPDVDDPTMMVRIPAGAFEMGRSEGAKDEGPRQSVSVDAFYIDIYEVTNAAYKKFIEANPQWQKANIADRFHDSTYTSYIVVLRKETLNRTGMGIHRTNQQRGASTTRTDKE